ncbi:hypothetical protein JCM10207_003998 [Rhodosporidiobolus poonsookiae]
MPRFTPPTLFRTAKFSTAIRTRTPPSRLSRSQPTFTARDAKSALIGLNAIAFAFLLFSFQDTKSDMKHAFDTLKSDNKDELRSLAQHVDELRTAVMSSSATEQRNLLHSQPKLTENVIGMLPLVVKGAIAESVSGQEKLKKLEENEEEKNVG